MKIPLLKAFIHFFWWLMTSFGYHFRNKTLFLPLFIKNTHFSSLLGEKHHFWGVQFWVGYPLRNPHFGEKPLFQPKKWGSQKWVFLAPKSGVP